MSLAIPVLYGSVRTDRVGIRAARYVCDRLRDAGHTPTLVDPVEVDLPLLDRMHKEYAPGEAPDPMERLAGLYREADAFVIVSGEYNHLPPPALVNLLDHFLNAYYWRPAGIVTYSRGSFGGVRAGVHLRDMLAELGMMTTPTALAYPRVGALFDAEGAPVPTEAEGLATRFGRFETELTWVAEALRAKRAEGVPYT
ncbi:MAG: NADPH-dependent FMN reductase [Rhodothermaceae bacterium]|nr:NADPH-dependent FMN reductase [Rhodothermaceae bacterium]MBC14634.1 NADPH-dependent FMN reductase [Rhodothermaceae bacterium]